MAKELDITVESQEVRKFLEKAPPLLRQVERDAVNKTAKRTKGQIAKEIGKPGGILNAPAKDVKEVIRIKRRAKTNSPLSEIEVTGRAIRLGKFQPKRTKKGVTFKIFKSGKRQLAGNAFIIKKGNFTGVFVREQSRQEVTEFGGAQFRQMWGPAVSDVFDFSPETERKILDDTNETFEKELLSQISRRLDIPLATVTGAFS